VARPPHPVGTSGNVRSYRTASGWRSRTTVRDYDDKTREIERAGRTKAEAQRKLATALRDRVHTDNRAELTPDSRVALLVDRWIADFESKGKALRTVEQYRYAIDRSILPGLGALRIRELTVAACDRFLRAVEAKHGAPAARTTRSVLSGLCGYAARRDLIDRNPVRDTGVISTKPKSPPRSMTIEQVHDLRASLTYDDLAIRRDIPDFVGFMLATGLRISEAAAVVWGDVDLTRRTVAVRGNVVRVKGMGLVVQADESSKLTIRTLVLPEWEVELLRQRYDRESCPPSCPVFSAPKGGLRDPSNTQADLRAAFKDCGYGWVTSHVFRTTVASLMDEAGKTARAVADQLGHSQPSMSQNKYMGRRGTSDAAEVLEVLGDG
jgi:integrase